MSTRVKDAKHMCNACGACRNACPCNSITMQWDEEGFSYPMIDSGTCVNCGLCMRVCPVEHISQLQNKEALEAFAVRHKDDFVISQSTSGGAFSALSDIFCDKDSYVAGAVYGENFSVRHVLSSFRDGVTHFRKSKYLQSDTGVIFQEIRALLQQGNRVLFSGTPCQVAGLKSYLKGAPDNLLLVEIVCHGVPSPLFFNKYRAMLEKKFKGELCRLDFRDNSKRSWKHSEISLQFDNGRVYRCLANYDDPFIHGFHAALFQRPSCYNCSFAGFPRCADITLGDFWGVEHFLPTWDDGGGVSLVFFNTSKAKTLIPELKKVAWLEPVNPMQAMSKKHLSEPHPLREVFVKDLASLDFEIVIQKYLPPRPWYRRVADMILPDGVKRKIKKYFNSSKQIREKKDV